MNRPEPTSQTHRRAQSGFTLIEMVLAMVLGAMVLVGSLGVFFSLRNMESTFAARFERTSELDITHTIFTRAMLSLQMEETQTNIVTRAADTNTTTAQDLDEEPESRYRMILETDMTVAPDSTGWTPQRFEIVNATPPVPSGLATQAAGWFVAQDQSNSVDFSAMDGSQGIVRGVFELRPSGQRERIMQQLGLLNANDPILDQTGEKPTNAGVNTQGFLSDLPAVSQEKKPNWTLWWRPILGAEGEQLRNGLGPFPDSIGAYNDIRARLAGAVPLMRNIERCTWELFKSDEFVSTFAALSMSDLPAYAQFEVILTNGQYASWMFEIDWVLGDDPSTAGSGAGAGDVDEDQPADPATGPGGNNNNNNGDGRPGNPNDPGADTVIDINNGS